MNESLLALGAATVGESGARALAPGLVPLWPGAVLAARAFPVRCGVGDNLAVHRGVAAAPPESVLVVAVDGMAELGWWGEVLTVAASARGLSGLVIDACVRDTAAIALRRFPVWSRGVALPGAAKLARGSVGDPITIRGVEVTSGDWVIADADGVAVVAAASIDAVVSAGRARAEAETAMFGQLEAGRTTLELLDLGEEP